MTFQPLVHPLALSPAVEARSNDQVSANIGFIDPEIPTATLITPSWRTEAGAID